MPPHKIRQEWLTLDEAAEVIRQHNITLLPADLIRHALHGDLPLSVYFPSPVLIRPLNPPCRFACRFSKPPFPPSQCNKPGNRKVMANSPPCRRDPTLRLTTSHLWDLPLIGLERLLLHQRLAQTLNCPCPHETHCCNQIGIVLCDENGSFFQLCNRKSLREVLLELLGTNGRIPEELHALIAQLYSHGRDELQPRLNLSVCYLPDTLPPDALFVIRRSHLEAFLTRHQPESKERISSALSRLLWLACKHNPQLDDKMLEHPYKLLNIFECWAREDGMHLPLSPETLKTALQRGAPP
ncbi:hypothetical protein FMJ84_16110 [Klebsiella oxytoca]|uniref:hypothetical protein n=1 Tax=Klebsiella oxytoca TaxID=571 RepID=UPI001CCA141D|nr:hypothetical protein [Klebsiella oxytoca]MBZ6767838.1 hypothetical protein [Klebsiella oxytoca]